jgi:transposase
LGVDDFALCKGRRYGTILLDLEQHHPIDLLPERSAEVLETWLRQHPGIEIIARDRGAEYIRGATAGAPNAIQVADRFHLLSNLREALERVIDRAHANLRTRLATTLSSTETISPSDAVPLRPRRRTGREATMRTERRARRLARYETVQLLHRQGKSKRQIAQELGLSRWLVRRFVEGHPRCSVFCKPQATQDQFIPFAIGFSSGVKSRRRIPKAPIERPTQSRRRS